MSHSLNRQDNGEEYDPLRERLWSKFGIESEAGKLLYQLYRPKKQVTINYPPVRVKSQQQLLQERTAKPKKCPQQQRISYPVPRQAERKYYQIDYIPHRKQRDIIQNEMDDYYAHVEVPVNKGRIISLIQGVDRNQLIKELQQKRLNQRGALPKKIELPAIDQSKLPQIDKTLAYQKLEAKYKIYDEKEDDKSPTILQQPKQTSLEELDTLFDNIVAEIEERQAYLIEIRNLDMKKQEEKIQREIVERVSELQRLAKIKAEHSSQ